MSIINDKLKEYCGIFGISCNDFSYSVSELIYHGLMAIQHRGQLFSGVSITNCNRKIASYKNWGLVSKVFNPRRLKTFSGNVGIGHVCSKLNKGISVEDAQPYHFKSDQIEFSLAMNGAITNYDEIYNKLRNMGRIFVGNSDIELIATLIETFSKFSENMVDTLKMAMNIIKGAYSLVLLQIDGNLYAMRDPVGYKPLCWGNLKINNKKFYIIASESCALDALGGTIKGDVVPGQIIKVNPLSGLKKFDVLTQKRRGICQFEYIYFSRPDSIIDGVSVAEVRYRLGKNLARNDNFHSNEAIVVPVPDSGRSAGMGYAWESGITYQEGLMKNRYIWHLKSDVKDKLNPIKSIVKGKDIVLIDDSILSGITLKKIISMLKNAGAKSVHIRISCPPIINNCEINNNFSNRNLLIAYQKRLKNKENYVEEIRKYIKADSLKFQTIEGLLNATGLNENQICLDCVNDQIHEKGEVKGREIELII